MKLHSASSISTEMGKPVCCSVLRWSADSLYNVGSILSKIKDVKHTLGYVWLLFFRERPENILNLKNHWILRDKKRNCFQNLYSEWILYGLFWMTWFKPWESDCLVNSSVTVIIHIHALRWTPDPGKKDSSREAPEGQDSHVWSSDLVLMLRQGTWERKANWLYKSRNKVKSTEYFSNINTS